MESFDVVVIGAGAAGMMCAREAGARGRRVLVLDHAKAPGEKIRISGGGRCNFTNIHTAPDRFICGNPGFAISALSRYKPAEIIALFESAGIAWHEKKLGQLFFDGSATQAVALFVKELTHAGATLRLNTPVREISRDEWGFRLRLDAEEIAADALVIATGGKSIPKMGATGFGYDVAARFGVPVVAPRPGLVPFTLDPDALRDLAPLSGVSLDVSARTGPARFDEAMLFTHRGLSGPAILQLSSYWREGDEITLDMAPTADLYEALRALRGASPRQSVAAMLGAYLPKRLAQLIAEANGVSGNIGALSDDALARLARAVKAWRFKPASTEGYRTAEVTVGGVDTRALDQRTMAVKAVPGLYFIGEVVDVTGWLGGYNFQWAWASGWCAGQVV